MYNRITHHAARKMFFAGEIVVFCPCKMYPCHPISFQVFIHPSEYLSQNATPQEAWKAAIRNFNFHNASWETGYYPHFYKQV